MRSRCSTWKASVASSCESSVSPVVCRDHRAPAAPQDALRRTRRSPPATCCWQARDAGGRFRVGLDSYQRKRLTLRPVPNEASARAPVRASSARDKHGSLRFLTLGGRPFRSHFAALRAKFRHGDGFGRKCARRNRRKAQSAATRFFRHFLREDRALLDDPQRHAHRLVDGILLLGCKRLRGVPVTDLTAKSERRRTPHLRQHAAAGRTG